MSKLGILEDFGNAVRKTSAEWMNSVNPLRTFGMQQRRKLAAEVGGTFMPLSRGMSTDAGRIMRRNEMSSRPDIGFGKRIQAYFNGYNMDDLVGMPKGDGISARSQMSRMERANENGHSLYAKVAAKRANVRRVTAGVVGAATIGTVMLGRDNMVSEGGISGMTLGATGIAAGTIASLGTGRVVESGKNGVRRMRSSSNLGALGAAGLVGYTALNMYRSGDQTGPF